MTDVDDSLTTRTIEFRGHSFVLATTHPGDSYFQHVQSGALPAAVHVGASLCGPSSTIIDVGANIGLCSLAYSRVAQQGRVLAFEPGRRAFSDLIRGIQLNNITNIEAYDLALGREAAELTLLEPVWNSSGAFVRNVESPASELHASNNQVDKTTTAVRTLDSIVEELELSQLDFVKIDVEGHETAVLDGARRTMEMFRPATLVELNVFTLSVFANQNPLSFVIDLLERFPYVVAVANDLGREHVTDTSSAYQLIHRSFVTGQVYDLLCSWRPVADAITDR